VQWIGRLGLRTTERLNAIVMTAPGTPSVVRRYELGHVVSEWTTSMLLDEVRECVLRRFWQPLRMEYQAGGFIDVENPVIPDDVNTDPPPWDRIRSAPSLRSAAYQFSLSRRSWSNAVDSIGACYGSERRSRPRMGRIHRWNVRRGAFRSSARRAHHPVRLRRRWDLRLSQEPSDPVRLLSPRTC
jgi:hypothetical protein